MSKPWTPSDVPFSQSVRKPSGAIFLGSIHVADTIQCCHCQMHFVSVRGSGHLRGWCTLCGAMTCGHQGCDAHMPWEKKMELLEKAARVQILRPGQW